MFEKRYKDEMQKISPTKDLINQTKAAMRVELEDKNPIVQKESHVRTYRARKSVLIAAIMAILLLSATAFAALGGFDWFIARFNPNFAGVVEPVMSYSEEQGIRMTIIGAQRFANMAIVYLSVQDVSGENRLTERIDFSDGFSVGRGISFGYQRNLLYFDSVTNTAYFEIRITADANSPLPDPLMLGSLTIIFGMDSYRNEPMGINLSAIGQGITIPVAYENIFVRGYGGEQGSVLPPNRMLAIGNRTPLPHGTRGAWLSNIGIVDGQLHIQTNQYFTAEFGSNFSLLAPNGDVIYSQQTVDVWLDADGNLMSHGIEYRPTYRVAETIFDVNIANLSNYTLVFSANVPRGIFDGNWWVEVNTSDVSQQMIALTNDVSVDGILFEFITISPLGLQVIGSYTGEIGFRLSELSVKVETSDGVITLSGGGGRFGNQTFNASWDSDLQLNITTVTAIIVNDLRIEVY
ncbi:MAG: hypothetical protein FWE04_05715 [Oscillospiraceae bacterium]|nr:hypothetical protein [Oscillospiraceae bacterium]